MRRVSKKRAREIRLAKPARDAFAEEFPRCMVCGVRHSLETHEIARGPHRRKAYGQRCCWLRLCQNCHTACSRYLSWPIQKQLALKKLCDPEYYDLELFNVIRSRAITAVNQDEIDAWCRLMEDGSYYPKIAS